MKARLYIREHEYGWSNSPTLAAFVLPSYGNGELPLAEQATLEIYTQQKNRPPRTALPNEGDDK